MICYRVHIPCGVKVAGVTAQGQPTAVLPGEYLVNVLRPKMPTAEPLLRFVGADPGGRDVHVPCEVAERYLASSANDGVRFDEAEAA